jgi:hypothetical protein
MNDSVYELVPMAHVLDVEKSIQFYELLGFRVRERVRPGNRTQWAWITSGRGHLMLAAASGPVALEEQAILFYLYTRDLPALRSRLLAHGLADAGAFCGTPTDRRRIVYDISHPPYMQEGEMRIVDPDGYCLLVGQCELPTS